MSDIRNMKLTSLSILIIALFTENSNGRDFSSSGDVLKSTMFLLNKRALCTLHTHGLGRLLSQWVAQNNLTEIEVGNSFHLRVLWGLVHTQLIVFLITISCIVSVLFPDKLSRISKYVQLFPHYQSSFGISHSYCLSSVSPN